ncbi:MAG: thioredoxin family protein [Ignavibacteriaceae bacterium]
MQLKIFLTAVLVLFISVSAIAAAGNNPEKYENFTLKDYTGKEHSLDNYKDAKAIVILFIATQCPISNDYNSRMADLYNEYKSKDVAFIGINSNKQEDVAEIRTHAKKNGLDFVILKDDGNVIADRFKASFTPEIYVLSPDYELLYHGRIDDSRKADNIKSKDLENALNEILDGKSVSVKKTKAFGCTIKRV